MSKWSEPRHDKTNKMSVRPVKTQISLGSRPVWSESSTCPQWVVKDPSFLHADSDDSDQTGRMPRLIWVFAGRTATLFVLSCRGSLLFALEAAVSIVLQTMCLSAPLWEQEKRTFRSIFSKVFEWRNIFYAIIAIKYDFLIHLHLLGPSGGVETLAFQALVSTPPSGPSRC